MYFCALYTSSPKESKNAIKMISANIFLGVIAWYTLNTKFSRMLMLWQMQILTEFYNIWPTSWHICNMPTTFPTKLLIYSSFRKNSLFCSPVGEESTGCNLVVSVKYNV